MSYLVDTDRVADLLSGRTGAVRLLAQLRTDGLAISLITYGEIYEGICCGRDPRANEEVCRRFLRWVDAHSLNRSTMRRFARLRGERRRRGRQIPDPDRWIGATALHHSLALVAGDRAHFERIPDLAICAPSASPP
jgi:predicted nucleic acid-binding protein